MPNELRQIGFAELQMYLENKKTKEKQSWQQSILIANHLRNEDADPLTFEDLIEDEEETRTTKEKLNQKRSFSKFRKRLEKARNNNGS